MRGVHDPQIELFVNGTLMRGLALHANLGGASLIGEATTSPAYRLYAVGTVHPAMVRDDAARGALAGELYALPLSQLAPLLAGEPRGLGLGAVELQDHGWRLGIVWVGDELPADAVDVTALGGWRAYLAQREAGTRSDTPAPATLDAVAR